MALNISPAFFESASTTAGARISNAIASRMSPAGIKAVQRLTTASDFVAGILGLDNIEDQPQPLLGGISLAEARTTYAALRDAGLARKSLWFLEIEDLSPPDMGYGGNLPPASRPIPQDPLSATMGVIRGGIGGVTDRISAAVRSQMPATGGGAPRPTVNLPFLFNLFATSVSYEPSTLAGEKVRLGGAVMDMVTGGEPVEMSITTMDDEVGTIKRWFDAKTSSAARPDGTIGLPRDYCVRMKVYHATPRPDKRAYAAFLLMRPVTIRHELSRQEQALAELTLTFSQFDTFMSP